MGAVMHKWRRGAEGTLELVQLTTDTGPLIPVRTVAWIKPVAGAWSALIDNGRFQQGPKPFRTVGAAAADAQATIRVDWEVDGGHRTIFQDGKLVTMVANEAKGKA